MFWLDWHLQFYHPGLEYILIFPKYRKEKIHLLIISCANLKNSNLEKDAPKLKDWKFSVILRHQTVIKDTEIEINNLCFFQDITLKASKLKFIPLKYNGLEKIKMIVFSKNFTIYSHNNNLSQLVYMLTHGFFSEKSSHEINFVQLAQAVNDKDLIRLYELQFYLDEINNSSHNQ
jgi:hypothetical protein